MKAQDLKTARATFADDIRQLGQIKTAALIEGLANIPREDFLGPGPWRILRAAEMSKGYQSTADADPRRLCDNVLVALDEKRRLNNGEPLGLMLFMDALSLAPGDRFLHIGCGVGYYTAIAAHAVGATGSVVAVEIDPELGARARRNLAGYPNITVSIGDGGTQTFGQFDAIFINAGCTEPKPLWLDQLKLGGRLLAPLTVELPPAPGTGAGQMLRVTKRDEGYDARITSPVGIFHCHSARTAEGNKRLGLALAQGDVEAIRSLRRDAHEPGPSCWLHGDTCCLQADPALRSPPRQAVSIDAEVLSRYVGRYQLTPSLVLAITQLDGALFAQASGQKMFAIYPESSERFFFKAVNAQITFVAAAGRPASGLILHQGGHDISASRIE